MLYLGPHLGTCPYSLQNIQHFLTIGKWGNRDFLNIYSAFVVKLENDPLSVEKTYVNHIYLKSRKHSTSDKRNELNLSV